MPAMLEPDNKVPRLAENLWQNHAAQQNRTA